MTDSPAQKFSPIRPALFCAALLIASALPGHTADLLTAGPALALAGTHGRFDFIVVDVEGRRLLAAHTGNGTLDVIDMDKPALVKAVPTGAAQAAAVDAKGHRYFASVSKPPSLVTIDAGKLEVVGKVPLGGPADLMAFSAKSGLAYVGHDDGKELWVVDPVARKIVATIELPGEAPEDLGFDAAGARIFQAMKTGNVVAVIDVATHKVVAKWPTAPAEGPHGMAMVPEADAFLAAGANGKLVMMSQKDGHVISTAEIGGGVDQIAYDAELHRVYCASGKGKLVVVGVEKEKLTLLGDVATSDGARSVAVDAKTHTVWIAYAKGDASFAQPFTPVK